MANKGPDTNGSQFFRTLADDCNKLNGRHVVFGKVTKGLEVIDSFEVLLETSLEYFILICFYIYAAYNMRNKYNKCIAYSIKYIKYIPRVNFKT